MAEITRSDLYLIFKAAAQMSSIDADVAEQEKTFLKKLAHTGNLSNDEIKKLRSSKQEDVETLSDGLSSQTAKKVFLLALATMAKADHELSKEELEMLSTMTNKLNIGRVKTREMSYELCENMVLKLLSQSVGSNADDGDTDSGEKFSDLDML